MKVGKRRGGMLLRQAVSLCLSLSMLVGLCLWALAAPAREAVTEEAIAPEPMEEPTQQISLEEPPPVEEPSENQPQLLSGTVAYAVEGGNIYFDPNTGKITGCDASVTKAVIPGKIDGIDVTSIGQSAFADCDSLTSVIIPDSVISIWTWAFRSCSSLTSVTIGNCVTSIGDRAFEYCSSLTSVTIPDSVTSIGNSAFEHCGSLTRLTMGNDVTTIGDRAFEYCGSLTSVTIPDTVTSIGNYAFYQCGSLTSVTVPDSVISIGDHAFGACDSLTSVTIPDSVTSIGDRAFSHCSSLTSVTIGTSVTSIGDSAFNGCHSLTSVTIPDTVTSIGNYAFYQCGSLTSVTIPDSVTTIGNYAFYWCDSLTSVTIGTSVTTIGNYAFYWCSSLTSVTIGTSVTTIGNYAFENCSSLTSVRIPDSVTTVGDGAFDSCSSLTSVTIGNGVTTIGKVAFSDCSFTSVTIPDSVTTIGELAFSGCYSLTSVTIGDSVTTIGNSAFAHSYNLTSAYFMGDAPFGDGVYPSNITIYYIDGKDGWTTPTWEGYRTVPIFGLEGATETHLENYYSKLTDYHFRFTDQMGQGIPGISLTVDGSTITGDPISPSLMFSYGGDTLEAVTIFKPGYHSINLPGYVLSTYNEVSLHPDSYDLPFAQAVYGSQDGGTSYNDLLNSGMSFSAGSLDEQTAFYIDVNWGNRSPGKIYLSQTLNPADGFEVTEGLNDAQNISMHLDSGSRLYLLMQTADGEVFTKALAATITEEDVEVDVDFGNSVDIDSPNDDTFLSKFKLGFKLPKNLDVSLSVENDGTVLGTIGVKIAEKKDVGPAVKTIKDALYYADNYPKDWDGFVRALKGGSIIPRSSTFGITLDAKVIGYLEGKLVRENDGSYGIQLTDGKLAAKFEGKLEKTWQIYTVTGVPFYVGGSVEPSVEFSTSILSGELALPFGMTPIDVKGSLPLKVRGGLGWDSIASAGIYGKGSITAELAIPIVLDELEVYVNASFGAEAKFFCFSADLEIYKTKNLYLYGGADKTSLLMQPLALDIADADWQPQSRDYLYAPTLFAVGEDDTQTGVETVLSDLYPYADVQTAALPDGSQLIVWTADPGLNLRAEDNNRTKLYYAYNTGSGWSSPAPVEGSDDGTADFNPVLQVLNGTAYLMWQDASRPLTGNDDVGSTAAAMDISIAAFDSGTGAFHAMGTVGTNHYDGAASIGMLGGQPAVVWASNSGENPLAASGRVGAIHRAVWDGTAWIDETLADGLGAIDQTTTDGNRIWFSADTDLDAGTFADRDIFLYDGSVTNLTNTNDVADTKPVYVDGNVLWYSGSTLVTGNGDTISLAVDTDRYSYVRSGSGLEAVVYVLTDGETRVSSLYASFNDGTGWGEPILLSSAGGNIGSFHAQFLGDGTLSIVTSERTVSEVTEEYEIPELSPAAQLKVYAVTPVCDLAVENVTYLPHSMVPGGTLDVQMDVANLGATAVNVVNVTVNDGTNTLFEQAYAAELLSGERANLIVGVPLEDEIPASLTVKVTPVGYSDGSTENNSASVALRLSDVSLEGGTARSDGAGTTATVLVVNRGQTDLNNVTLNLYQNGESTPLSTQSVPNLAVGDAQFVTFTLNQAMANNSLLRVEAAGVSNENVVGNNSCTVLVSAPPVAEVSLGASYIESDTGFAVVATIRNTTSSPQDYTICCASYDGNRRMLQVKSLESQTTESGGEDSYQLTLPANDASASSIKVFVLNSVRQPLTDCVELQIRQ